MKLLEDEQKNSDFQRFLEDEYAPENLYFFNTIQNFRLIQEHKKLLSAAMEIQHSFFEKKSKYELNLPNQLHHSILGAIRDQAVKIDMFDEAQKHVFEILREYTFSFYIFFFWLNEDTFSLKNQRQQTWSDAFPRYQSKSSITIVIDKESGTDEVW